MTQMTSGRMKLAEHARNVHIVSVPVGVTFDDVSVPSYWAHVAHQIKPKDRLELWAEDRSWFADAIVVKASRLEVHIRAVAYLDMDAVAEPAAARKDGYHVDFGGPVDLYRVIRNGDARIMTLGLTKPEAEQWIADQVAVETGRLVPMQAAAQAYAADPIKRVEHEPLATLVPGSGDATEAPADGTYIYASDVTIPDNWRSLSWQDRRSLASKLTDDAIHNGDEANAAIEAALAKRTSAAA